jgi:hypothetical protein
MAINISAMKEMLEGIQNPEKAKEKEQNKRISTTRWSPKATKEEPGQYTVRILPSEDGIPIKAIYQHYVGRAAVLCRKRNHGLSCPICELATEMWNSNQSKEKEAAKKLFANKRYHIPVIVREDIEYLCPETGEQKIHTPRWYSFGKTLAERLLLMISKPEKYGDITDLETGCDFELIFKLPSNPQAFAETTLERLSPSPLTKDEKLKAFWIKNIPAFDEVFKTPSEEEVREILDKQLSPAPSAGGDDYKKYGGDNNFKQNSTNSELDEAINELSGDSSSSNSNFDDIPF